MVQYTLSAIHSQISCLDNSDTPANSTNPLEPAATSSTAVVSLDYTVANNSPAGVSESQARSRERSSKIHRTKARKLNSSCRIESASDISGNESDGYSSYGQSQDMSELPSHPSDPHPTPGATQADEVVGPTQAGETVVGYDCHHLSTQDIRAILETIRADQTPTVAAPQRHSQAIMLSSSSNRVDGGNHLDHIQAHAPQLSRSLKHPAGSLDSGNAKRQRLDDPDNTDTEDEDTEFEDYVPKTEPEDADGLPGIFLHSTQQPSPPPASDLAPSGHDESYPPNYDPFDLRTQLDQQEGQAADPSNLSRVPRSATTSLANISPVQHPPPARSTSSISLGQPQPARSLSTSRSPSVVPLSRQPSAAAHPEATDKEHSAAMRVRSQTLTSGPQSERPSSRLPARASDSSMRQAQVGPSRSQPHSESSILHSHRNAGQSSRRLDKIRAQLNSIGTHLQVEPQVYPSVNSKVVDSVMGILGQILGELGGIRGSNGRDTILQAVCERLSADHEANGGGICAPEAGRSGDQAEAAELVPDDEEQRVAAAAAARGEEPRVSGRKPKPAARDVFGNERQVLTVAKPHLFAFSLVEGAYQTRATFMRWALIIFKETWEQELPGVPFVHPSDQTLQIMVNGMATMRGKIKELLRPFIQFSYEFIKPATNVRATNHNLEIFLAIHPNRFHCLEYKPAFGHYESDILTEAIAIALFSSPTSIGVTFRDFFEPMPHTVVAFILANMQFCIEEWDHGQFQPHALDASDMLNKYICHLKGLKEAQAAAKGRMARLQQLWFDFGFEHSGAITLVEPTIQPITHRDEVCPDTPPLANEFETDDNGRYTTRAKGKGRARD